MQTINIDNVIPKNTLVACEKLKFTVTGTFTGTPTGDITITK